MICEARTTHLSTQRQQVHHALTHSVEFDSYGNIESQSNASHTVSIGYTGRYYDAATGLQWNRARWYDPSTGRWMNQDPIGFAAGDANLYRYVGNEPTNATDPSGLQKRIPRPIAPPRMRDHYVIGPFADKYPNLAPTLDDLLNQGYRLDPQNRRNSGYVDDEAMTICFSSSVVTNDWWGQTEELPLSVQIESLRRAIDNYSDRNDVQLETIKDLIDYRQDAGLRVVYGPPTSSTIIGSRGGNMSRPNPLGTLTRPTDVLFADSLNAAARGINSDDSIAAANASRWQLDSGPGGQYPGPGEDPPPQFRLEGINRRHRKDANDARARAGRVNNMSGRVGAIEASMIPIGRAMQEALGGVTCVRVMGQVDGDNFHVWLQNREPDASGPGFVWRNIPLTGPATPNATNLMGRWFDIDLHRWMSGP